MMIRSCRPLTLLSVLSLTCASLIPVLRADASVQQVPASVAALLPSEARLGGGSFAVFDTEFGKTFSGEMRAVFPGRPVSCDNTIGPELRVSLKGDTAWDTPPMLDMAVQQYTEDIAAARKGLPQRMGNLRSSNSSVQSVSPVREEKTAAGELIYVEYTEDCASRRGGTNTVLRGFARRGATMLSFDLWLSANATETTAIAREMLARFAKLNIPALLR
jgi:hypothetical protein